MQRSASVSDVLRDRPIFRAAALVILCILIGVVVGASVSVGPVWVGFVLLIAAAGGFAILRSVDLALAAVWAIALLLPFGALPFKIAVTPTLLELALLALLGVTALRILAVPDVDLRLSPLGGAIFAWLGLTIFALILGAGGLPDNLTLHNYVKFVLAVLLFFGVLNVVRTRTQADTAMRWIILGGTAAALLGIGLYALPDTTALRLLTALGRLGYPTTGRVLRYVNDDPAGVERAIGTSVDPNSFGGALSLIAALTAAQIWARKPVLPRRLLIGAAAILALSTFLTQSRAAMGGIVAAMLFLAIVRERRLWWLIGAGAVGALIAGMALGPSNPYVARVIEGVFFRDQANQMRLAEYRNAIEIIRRYPLFGVGFGAAPELGLVTGVSSIYLAMGQRIGLIGLGLFIGIMVAFFVQTLRALRRIDGERAAMVLGVQAGVIAALAVGLLDHYFFNIEFSHMAALLWGVVGLGMALIRDDLEKPSHN